MKNKTTKLTALILSIAFLFSFGITAFAAEDKDTTVTVTADTTHGDQSVEVGNINTTNYYGLDITAQNGKTATATTGSITADEYGVDAEAWDEGSTVNVTVNGDTTGTDDCGVCASAEDKGTVTVDVTGNSTGEYYGVYAGSEDEGTTVTVNVGGNAEGTYEYGVYAEAYYGRFSPDCKRNNRI